MTDSLSHRGPDGEGIFVDDYIGFGHRRLAIIDLSACASQPMQTENKRFVISYNGEVYNFKELRSRLAKEGMKFSSHSDTEVVLKAFARWGRECISSLNGMFAFALWDIVDRRLTLARDRYGIKPLYYWQNQKVFLFASEIKAFFEHPEFRIELDLEVLPEYFTFQNIFTSRTFFKGVKVLPQGNFMAIDFKGGFRSHIEQYWDFQFKAEEKIMSDSEYLEELNRLFRQAVKRQLVSDVEVGSYLSGGIDSGAVTAVASEHFNEFKTFCIGFDLSSVSGLELSFDERRKAEHISYLYQTEHYEMVLKSGDMKRCLPSLVRSLEDLRLGQSYPNFYASKLASRFVKVCLSGAGGDELFAGYPWRYYRNLKCRHFDDYISGYYQYWQRLIPDTALEDFFTPVWDKVKGVCPQDIFNSVLNNYRPFSMTSDEYINYSLYFEAKTFLHGLLLVEDKLSMAQGLEVRIPFLDNDLVDFATKVPIRLKLNDIDRHLKVDENESIKKEKYFAKTRDGKVILRKVLGRYVGDKAAGQQKQGFSGPDASWFKGESIDYLRQALLGKKALIYDFFNYKAVSRIIQQHISGRENRRLFIWSLLCFESWIEQFLLRRKPSRHAS